MQNQPNIAPPREIKFCRLNLPPEFPVALMREDKWYSSFRAITMVHFHNCLQIGYCEAGKGYYLVDGALYPYSSECVSLVPAKALHFCASRINTVSRWKWLYLDPVGMLGHRLTPAYSQLLAPLSYGRLEIPCVVSQRRSTQIVRLVQSIISELEDPQAHYKETVRALTEALVLAILRICGEAASPGPDASPASLQLISPAIEWISMHYMDPITVPQLARHCHISPTHLRRLFQNIMNCSPLEYLQNIRLEAACGMLLHTDRSVLDIGSESGFATPTSFTRQFKKQYGTTPGQWRLHMAGQNEG